MDFNLSIPAFVRRCNRSYGSDHDIHHTLFYSRNQGVESHILDLDLIKRGAK